MVMDSYNLSDQIYYVHLDKDIGRLHCIETLQALIGGRIWEGINAIKYDKFKLPLNVKNEKDVTLHINKTYLKLLKHLTTCSHDFYIIFEDDIITNKKIVKYWYELQEYLANPGNNEWDIIYLGISSPFPHIYPSHLEFVNLECNKIISGAFGFVIHEKIISKLIEKIERNLLTENKPFDLMVNQLFTTNIHQRIITQPLLVTSYVDTSNCRKPKDQTHFSEMVSWDITQYEYSNKIHMSQNIISQHSMDYILSIFNPYGSHKTISKDNTIKLNSHYFPSLLPKNFHRDISLIVDNSIPIRFTTYQLPKNNKCKLMYVDKFENKLNIAKKESPPIYLNIPMYSLLTFSNFVEKYSDSLLKQTENILWMYIKYSYYDCYNMSCNIFQNMIYVEYNNILNAFYKKNNIRKDL